MEKYYQNSKDFFNQAAGKKGGYFDSPKSFAYFFQNIIKKKALSLAANEQPSNILEVACGRGDFTSALAKYFKQSAVEGADFSEGMIKIASTTYIQENIKFFQADVRSLPFEDRSFDIVFFLDTFHIIRGQDHQNVVRELARVSRDAVILDFRYKRNIFNPLYAFLFKKDNPGLEYAGVDITQITKLFEKNGFKKEKLSPLFFFSFISPVILAKFVRK